MNSSADRRLPLAFAGACVLLAGFGLVSSQAQGLVDDTRPGGTGARAYQARIGTSGTFIRVRWSRPSNVPSSSILGYVVRRGDTVTPLAIVGSVITDAEQRFVDSSRVRTVRAFDGDPGDLAGSRTDFDDVRGIEPGQRYSYQVSAAYRNGLQDRDGDDAPDDEEYMTPLSNRTRYVTALEPPSIVRINGQAASNNQEVDPLGIQVEWEQTPGANRYVIWVSPDPTFRRGRKEFPGGTTVSVDSGGPATVSKTINAAVGKLRTARRLFVTVGARATGDPRPAPRGAIFGRIVQLRPLSSPPPPP